MNIVISGTVGVGKSTISELLYEELRKNNKDVFLIKELPQDDPYLEYYYKNRPSWTFVIQIHFLLSRFNDTYKYSQKKGIKIFDRHFLDDYIIASMPFIKDDMNNLSWNTYYLCNKELESILSKGSNIDYFFLLKSNFQNVLNRVSDRGRESEKDVDIKYWQNMYNQYYDNEHIQNYINKNVEKLIIINADNSPEKIIKDILKEIK